MIKILIASLMILTGISYGAQAQSSFTGTLNLSHYHHTEEGEEDRVGGITLMSNPDRLYIDRVEGMESLEELAQTSINHALIRHDEKDIILYGRGEQAIRIQNEEFEAMIRMMENLQQGSGQNRELQEDISYRETGETREIDGYRAARWDVESAQHGQSFRVWLTDELNIEWGLLADGTILQMLGFEDLPVQQWLESGQTPLLMERYEADRKVDVIRLDNIRQGTVDEARLQIPEGKEMLSVQEIMMRRFQQR